MSLMVMVAEGAADRYLTRATNGGTDLFAEDTVSSAPVIGNRYVLDVSISEKV